MKTIVTSLVLLFTLVGQALGQSEIVKELNKNIIALESLSPDSCFSDLEKLDGVLADKKIVGLGEATHGTHEFFVYKHRMIKYLVTEKNFKVFIIEGDFAGSENMNKYVLEGKGSLDEGLFTLGYSVWMRDEFVEMIEWMKEYNKDKAYADKVKFYGCDMNNERLAAQKVKEYLMHEAGLSPVLEEGLDWVIEQKYRKKLSAEDRQFVDQFLKELKDAFENGNEKADRSFQFMKQCKREVEQFVEMVLADSKTRIILRDKFMAENVEWIYHHENNQKAVFWAHNQHLRIDKAESYQKPTGYYLKEKFKEAYYAFGLCFYSGKVMGYNREERKMLGFEVPDIAAKKSTDATFKLCAAPNFILDFKTASQNRVVSDFLNTKLAIRTIGAGVSSKKNKFRHFKESKLIETFDGVVFFRDTKPSTVLKR
eukprot:TRINITY_DN1107_c0_g3_i1.p1 TRINITY_DN1107_c0_g3~~TRINITY_DN1107_c0_g3_i1.p1  ORF type:complete len:425 (-),score=13.74 TRINITY_DN1107_c0_g3_i1:82-1356(-)